MCGGHCPCHERARQPPSLPPRTHQSPHLARTEVAGTSHRRPPCALLPHGRRWKACFPWGVSLGPRRREAHGDATVCGCGSYACPSGRALRPACGDTGAGRTHWTELLALLIPVSARRSARARRAPRARSCAERTSRRSTTRCWPAWATTPPTAEGTWAPGEVAPSTSQCPQAGGGAPCAAHGRPPGVTLAQAISRPCPSRALHSQESSVSRGPGSHVRSFQSSLWKTRSWRSGPASCLGPSSAGGGGALRSPAAGHRFQSGRRARADRCPRDPRRPAVSRAEWWGLLATASPFGAGPARTGGASSSCQKRWRSVVVPGAPSRRRTDRTELGVWRAAWSRGGPSLCCGGSRHAGARSVWGSWGPSLASLRTSSRRPVGT